MIDSKPDYEVALSFAGEDRTYVGQVAMALQSLHVKVFYDGYEEENLWGKNLYTHLQEIYSKRAKYTVMFISSHYAQKLWTNHEREAAQARAFEENREYILPARFDDTAIPGMLATVGYIDLRRKTPEQLADLIVRKLRIPEQIANDRSTVEVIVDQAQRVGPTTINDAINQSPPFSRIVVRPGTYRESLTIDKPVTIVGDSDGEVLLESEDPWVVHITSSDVVVSHITIRQLSVGEVVAVRLSSGTPEINECTISSAARYGCIMITGPACPIVRRNRIANSPGYGIGVVAFGAGTVEDNEISGHRSTGVLMASSGNLVFRRNHVHHNENFGVVIHDCKPQVEENRVDFNTNGGIEIAKAAEPTLRRNEISNNGQGLRVGDGGRGLIEENRIFKNSLSGIHITLDSYPTVRNNQLFDNIEMGIIVFDGGGGCIEENEIYRNRMSGMEVNKSDVAIRHNRIYNNGQAGIIVRSHGTPLIEDNDLTYNGFSNIIVKDEGNPTVRDNRIRHGLQNGVYVLERGRGVFENNDVAANKYAGFAIKQEGVPVVRKNSIRDNDQYGVYVYQSGQGVFENNTVTRNNWSGFGITDQGKLTIRSNTIIRNRGSAIYAFDGGSGMVQQNDCRENESGIITVTEDSEIIDLDTEKN